MTTALSGRACTLDRTALCTKNEDDSLTHNVLHKLFSLIHLKNIECLLVRRLTHPEIWVGCSGGMVGTLDAGMSMDVSSSGRPRECSDSMEGRLEVDGWEGWLSGGSCDLDLVSVSPSSFWSVGPLSSPSPSPSLPLPSPSSPLTYEIKNLRSTHTPPIPPGLSSPLSLYTSLGCG